MAYGRTHEQMKEDTQSTIRKKQLTEHAAKPRQIRRGHRLTLIHSYSMLQTAAA
jgi:hypothetical protein